MSLLTCCRRHEVDSGPRRRGPPDQRGDRPLQTDRRRGAQVHRPGLDSQRLREYRQAAPQHPVAIHDMGNESTPSRIYTTTCPRREPVPGQENLVLDVGLPTPTPPSRTTRASTSSSTSTRNLTRQAVAQALRHPDLNRSENAGANPAATSASTSPRHARPCRRRALELGARGMELYGVAPTPSPAAGARGPHLTYGVVTRATSGKWCARALTRTPRSPACKATPRTAPRWAAMGRLRLAHPWFDGTLTGRYRSPTTPRSAPTPLRSEPCGGGALRRDRYPREWLPTSAFVMHQVSALEDGGPGVQHALGRLQLTREKLPSLSLQFGHTRSTAPTRTRAASSSWDRRVRSRALAVVHQDEALHLRRSTACRKRRPPRAATSRTRTRCSSSASKVRSPPQPSRSTPSSASARSGVRMTRTATSPGHRPWELNSGARSAIVKG